MYSAPYLADYKFGDGGIQKLLNDQWEFLRKLDLASNNLTDAAMEMLASVKWPELISLHISMPMIEFR